VTGFRKIVFEACLRPEVSKIPVCFIQSIIMCLVNIIDGGINRLIIDAVKLPMREICCKCNSVPVINKIIKTRPDKTEITFIGRFSFLVDNTWRIIEIIPINNRVGNRFALVIIAT
jgi:hypothetical protein